VYCLPIDIANLNLTGAQEGSNVTIQVVYNGGDDILFQVGPFIRTSLPRLIDVLVRGPNLDCERHDPIKQHFAVQAGGRRASGLRHSQYDGIGHGQQLNVNLACWFLAKLEG
jgi:hypothetical protein